MFDMTKTQVKDLYNFKWLCEIQCKNELLLTIVNYLQYYLSCGTVKTVEK